MSGYIARLMHQTGVKVTDANRVSPAQSATDVQEITSFSSPADVSKKEVRSERVSEHDKLVVRPPSNVEPHAIQPTSEGYRGSEKSSETRVLGRAAAVPTVNLLPTTPFISIGETEPRSTSEQEAPPPNTAPLPTEPFASDDSPILGSVSAEIVHEVMTWVADSGGTSRPAHIASDASPPAIPIQTAALPRSVWPQLGDNSSASPTTDDFVPGQAPDPEIVSLAAAHPSTLRSRRDEPWSVHIDTIQLTIEEPAAKPSPPPVAPRAASPARPQISPSRLRRHYLRTF
jgi:hypothetical protein